MSANELIIWILMFLILLGMRQYYGKKEAVDVEYLKGELFKIIAEQKHKFNQNITIAKTDLAQLVTIVDEINITNIKDYKIQLKKDLTYLESDDSFTMSAKTSILKFIQ